MFVTAVQRLEEDGRNGFISILYSPLNAEFMSKVNVLTFIHDAHLLRQSSYGRPFATRHV